MEEEMDSNSNSNRSNNRGWLACAGFISKNFGTDPIILGQAPLPNPDTNPDYNSNGAEEREGNRRNAIAIRHAFKKYGKGEQGQQVLSDLTLTVKEGTIYTLLGSSGCGKTTLLSCTVGLQQLDKGDIKLFGMRPGSKGCGIPGNKVGYMPQETAVYGEFTIREAMLYFGKINGMTTGQIEDRMAFLIKFLHLPPSYRFIRSLSGGQQRRVSFAVALLHEPKILILDEPTVGVDPLLRKSIWKHLTELVETGKTTVVITTHYMEEANEAHRIGLMRNGRLLAEDSPQNLLDTYNCAKLEDVFFKLCENDSTTSEFGSVRSSDSTLRSKVSDTDAENASADRTQPSSLDTDIPRDNNSSVAVYNETGRTGSSVVINPTFNSSVEQLIDDKLKSKSAKEGGIPPLQHASLKRVNSKVPDGQDNDDDDSVSSCFDKCQPSCDPVPFFNRMRALLMKNFLCMWRNLGFVFFIYCLPALQAVLFCVAIGGEPTQLNLGIINHEVENASHCQATPGCSLSNMSCNFVKQIPAETITLVPFANEADALAEVKQGNMWGYIVIPSNFSDEVLQKGTSGGGGARSTYQDGFLGMHIKLALDMTSQQISFAIQKTLSTAFQEFSTNLLAECGMNETTIDGPPLTVAESIYGTTNSTFREFMAPGIILSIIFFMSVALTGSAFITERKEGMMARTMVSGVTTSEIILAHMLTQYVTMIGQTVLVLAVMIWLFHVKIEGSAILAIFLTLAQGTCGMAYGFLISCSVDEERNAIQMALGSFYPNLLLSGVVWPLESMPLIIRKVAVFLPQTMACEAMRSIFSRGWGLTHPKVWPGFVVSTVWSGIFWILSIVLARIQRK